MIKIRRKGEMGSCDGLHKESVAPNNDTSILETTKSLKLRRRSEEEARANTSERKLRDACKTNRNNLLKIEALEERIQSLSTEHKNSFTETDIPLNYLKRRDNGRCPKSSENHYNKRNDSHSMYPSHIRSSSYRSYDEENVYGSYWQNDEDNWQENPLLNEPSYYPDTYDNETCNRYTDSSQRKSKPTYESIAKELLSSTSFFQYNNYLFLYTGKSYKLVETDERFRLEARRLLADNKKYEVLKSHLNEVKEMILTDIPRISNDEMERYDHYIAFENCIYDAKRNKSLPHSPDYLTIGFIKANYYEDLHLENPPKLFINYLKSVTKGDQLEVKRLCEAFAYWLSNYNKIRCYFILFGVSQSGKSTLTTLLQHLHGEEYVSAVPFHKLDKSFYIAEFFGKKINICGEISSSKLQDDGIFKMLTGNDLIMADKKYGQPFSFYNKAKIIFNGNIPMRIETEDNSEAIPNRIEIFNFPYSFPKDEVIPDFYIQLLKEKDAIVSFLMETLQELVASGFLLTKTPQSEKLKEEFTSCINPIRRFVEENCILNAKTFVLKDLLYKKYKESAQGNFKSKQEFYAYIEANYSVNQHKKRLPGSKNPRAIFVGIGLKEEWEAERHDD